MSNLWSKLEEDKLIELVSTSKFSSRDISNIIGRTRIACLRHITKLGLENKFLFKKYQVNEDFWSTPGLLNSYWAGFSAADACIQKNSETSFIYTLGLSSKDLCHLEQFKKDCNFNGKIHNSIENKSINNNDIKTYYTSRLSVSSTKWAKDLESNFNIIPNKTFRMSPPNLNTYLSMAWLAGYIDGDGSISIKKDGKGLRVDFISGSKQLIKWIYEFINSNFTDKLDNRATNYYKRKGRNSYHFNICGIRAAIIIDYLNQFPIPHLERKWLQPEILQKIQEYKVKYPHFFKTLNLSQIQRLILENNISQSTNLV